MWEPFTVINAEETDTPAMRSARSRLLEMAWTASSISTTLPFLTPRDATLPLTPMTDILLSTNAAIIVLILEEPRSIAVIIFSLGIVVSCMILRLYRSVNQPFWGFCPRLKAFAVVAQEYG